MFLASKYLHACLFSFFTFTRVRCIMTVNTVPEHESRWHASTRSRDHWPEFFWCEVADLGVPPPGSQVIRLLCCWRVSSTVCGLPDGPGFREGAG